MLYLCKKFADISIFAKNRYYIIILSHIYRKINAQNKYILFKNKYFGIANPTMWIYFYAYIRFHISFTLHLLTMILSFDKIFLKAGTFYIYYCRYYKACEIYGYAWSSILLVYGTIKAKYPHTKIYTSVISGATAGITKVWPISEAVQALAEAG